MNFIKSKKLKLSFLLKFHKAYLPNLSLAILLNSLKDLIDFQI